MYVNIFNHLSPSIFYSSREIFSNECIFLSSVYSFLFHSFPSTFSLSVYVFHFIHVFPMK
ncbi:hypothetical protein IC575_008928 [Cucumis melo]